MNANLNYESEFISFKSKLDSFIFKLVCNKQDMEDIVQETYIKTFKNINTFQRKSSFKTWVFAIATNIAKNHLKTQKLWKEDFQDKAAALHLKSDELMETLKSSFYITPDTQFEIKEHINYCFNCIIRTLNLSQQICLLLKEMYEFTVKEIIEITGLTEGKVKHNLSYARKNMMRIFDNRCALVNKKGICSQCTALMGVLNPEQNINEKANQLKLAKQKNNSDIATLLDLRIELIKGIDPLNSTNAHLHVFLLEHLPAWNEVRQ